MLSQLRRRAKEMQHTTQNAHKNKYLLSINTCSAELDESAEEESEGGGDLSEGGGNRD